MWEEKFKGIRFHSLSRKDGEVDLEDAQFFSTLYEYCSYAYHHTELMDMDEYHKSLDPHLMRMALRICTSMKNLPTAKGGFIESFKASKHEVLPIIEEVVLSETGFNLGQLCS